MVWAPALTEGRGRQGAWGTVGGLGSCTDLRVELDKGHGGTVGGLGSRTDLRVELDKEHGGTVGGLGSRIN